MTEVEKLKAALDRNSLKLSDAYKKMLADTTLDEQQRKLLQGQSNDCAEMIGLFRFIRVPEKQ